MSENSERGHNHNAAEANPHARPININPDTPPPQQNRTAKRIVEKAGKGIRRWFWQVIVFLDGHNGLVTALATVAIAYLTYSLAADSSRQAAISRGQLDTMQSQLDEMRDERRPWLKLVEITDAYVTKGEGVDVAWFHLKPHYKNLGLSPAEGTFFKPIIFVVGGGPSHVSRVSPGGDVCKTGSVWMKRQPSPSVLFPQDPGGDWTSAQVQLQLLKAEAAEVLAVQPSAPIYLGVVGCLLYHSGKGSNTYVTGFVADLRMIGDQDGDLKKHISLYNALVSESNSIEVGMDVKILDTWVE